MSSSMKCYIFARKSKTGLFQECIDSFRNVKCNESGFIIEEIYYNHELFYLRNCYRAHSAPMHNIEYLDNAFFPRCHQSKHFSEFLPRDTRLRVRPFGLVV